MKITFDSKLAGSWNPSTRRMRFLAFASGRPILCGVSADALEKLAHSTCLDEIQLRQSFEDHRSQIEQVAAKKILFSLFEPNTQDSGVAVNVNDLNERLL
jgi:hypothetical protein